MLPRPEDLGGPGGQDQGAPWAALLDLSGEEVLPLLGGSSMGLAEGWDGHWMGPQFLRMVS